LAPSEVKNWALRDFLQLILLKKVIIEERPKRREERGRSRRGALRGRE
jgi:hypothetical protein